MNAHISTIRHGTVLEIKIDRPDRKNALTGPMYLELTHQLIDASLDPQVDAVVLTGQPDFFCAGNDLSEFVKQSDHAIDDTLVFMRTLYCFEKPLIAAVAGPAIGIGATLLLHCDLVYAAESFRMSFPFLQLGVCTEFGCSRTLPRLLGHQRTMEILLFGDSIDAEKALALGLINEVVADIDLVDFALAKAQRLTGLPQKSVMISKKLIRRSEPDMLAIFEDEAREFSALLQTDESQKILSKTLHKK